VKWVDLETADRFTALQSGAVDVLVRNTTWTASRDGGEAATFLHPNFYDGQGMMVSSDSGYANVSDMNGAVVCVAKGTTTEGNAALESSRLGLDWEVRSFDETDLILAAFLAGQCDGWSSDVSQLTGLRSAYPSGADALLILPEVFSKEPLAPAVLDGDTQWAQIVNWTILATIQAEEFGNHQRQPLTPSLPAKTSASSASLVWRSLLTKVPPCWIQVLACPPTSLTKWSSRLVTTVRSSQRTSLP